MGRLIIFCLIIAYLVFAGAVMSELKTVQPNVLKIVSK